MKGDATEEKNWRSIRYMMLSRGLGWFGYICALVGLESHAFFMGRGGEK